MLIYDKNTILKEENFQNNGLGYLTDFMSEPIITEKLNGTFELQFDYLLTGNNAQYLENFNYIKAWYDDDYQLFYIERVKKQRNKISVYALHIAFTLTKNNLSDVRPTDLTAIAALDYILKRTDEKHYFNAVGNATKGGTSTMYFINKNPIEALLTADNSIINRLGGEIKYNNFNIGLYDQVGNDNGVAVLWGKNLKQFEQDNDISSVITRVIPIGKDGLTLPEGHIDSPLIESYPFPLIKTIDIDVGIEEDESKTEEQLRDDACERMRKEVQKLFDAGLDKPTTTVKIDWQDLSKTEEYKNYQFLEKIKLGDTITVKSLNILVKTRVIETKYNCLSKKYISFTLGDAKDTLFDGTSRIVKKEIKNLNLDPDSLLKQAQDNATKLLVNAMGGYVYKTNNELYIMDTDDPKTATRVWRWNINGLGYSKSGINGPYGLAMTMDGQIVADFITTGKMSVERIEGLEEILLMVQTFSDGIKIAEGNDIIKLDNVLTSELLYLQIYPTKEDLSYLNISPKTGLGNNTKLTSRDLLFLKDPKNVFNGELENGSIDKDGQNGVSPELDTTTYIELKEKLYSINDIADEHDVISGKGIKRIGEYIFTGDENFQTYNGTFYFNIDFAVSKTILNGYSNQYTVVNPISSGSQLVKNYTMAFFTNASRIYIKDDRFTSSVQLKESLKQQYDNGTPVKLFYVLETPGEFTTDPVNIQLRKGYNRIEINDKNGLLNKTKLSYLADTEKTVEDTNQIIIEDAEPVSARSLIVYGNSFQETGSGKNKFDINDVAEVHPNSNHLDYKIEGNKVTLTAIGASGAQYIVYYISDLDEKERYIVSYKTKKVVKGTDGLPNNKLLVYGSNDNISFVNIKTSIVTSPVENEEYKLDVSFTGYKYYKLSLYNNGDRSVTIGETTEYYDIQFEPGNEATVYESYLKKPSPEFPSEIECVEGISNSFNTKIITEKELKGGTYEIINDNNYIIDLTNSTAPGWSWLTFKAENLKKNTDYIFKFDLQKENEDKADIWTIIQTLPNSENGHIAQSYDADNNGLNFNSGNYETLYIKTSVNANATNNIYYFNNIKLCENNLEDIPFGKFLKLVDTGKNLFSGWNKGIGLSATNGREISSQTNASSDFIKINFKENLNYFISGLSENLYDKICAYNNSKEFLGRTAAGPYDKRKVSNDIFNQNVIEREDNEIAYIRVDIYENPNVQGTIDEVDNLLTQLEPGDQTTDYEPAIPNKVRNTEKFAIGKSTYTIDLTGATDVYLFFYDKNDNFINKSGYHKLPYTFSNTDASYVRFMFKDVNNDFLDVNDIKDLTIYDINANEPAVRYTLPCNLYYINDEIKDELIIDYENEQTFVIKRVGINAETGEKYALEEENIQLYNYNKIILEEGNYYVKMQSFNSGYIKVKYLSKTLYTSQYATKVGVEASLKLVEDTIIAGVNKQIVDINGEITKLSGELTVAAEEINSKVSKGAIISTINQSAEAVKILANKIGLIAEDVLNILSNNAINLSSKNIQIESDNLTVTSDGHLITKKGEFEDCTINGGYLNLKNGASVVGDNGLATNLIYPGYVRGTYTTGSGDFVPLGHVGGGDDANSQRNSMMFTFMLPTNFTIKSAKIYLLHAPITWVGMGDSNITGYSRNLKLYKLSNFSLTYNSGNGGIYSNSTGSEITNAFGTNGFSGNSSSASYAVSNDISSHISKTSLNQLFIRTSDAKQTSNKEIFARSGGVTGYLEIIGYMNF